MLIPGGSIVRCFVIIERRHSFRSRGHAKKAVFSLTLWLGGTAVDIDIDDFFGLRYRLLVYAKCLLKHARQEYSTVELKLSFTMCRLLPTFSTSVNGYNFSHSSATTVTFPFVRPLSGAPTGMQYFTLTNVIGLAYEATANRCRSHAAGRAVKSQHIPTFLAHFHYPECVHHSPAGDQQQATPPHTIVFCLHFYRRLGLGKMICSFNNYFDLNYCSGVNCKTCAKRPNFS